MTRFRVTVYLGSQYLVSYGKMIYLVNDSGKTWVGYLTITRPRGRHVGPSNTLQRRLPKP